jgi:DNA repair protein RecN (Recombination protein N)
MLQTLSLHQFVIVAQLELDFGNGFSVMTGETGAGKSILIDALDLLLGGKSDSTVVREGAAKTELAAAFDVAQYPQVCAWLEAQDLQADDSQLLLRRTIDRQGKSKAWINGRSVTLSQLRDCGEQLVDIHGQHSHQALLRPNAQRELLDRHAELGQETKAVQTLWRSWRKLREQLETARSQAALLAQKRDDLQWRRDEISALGLGPDEWAALSEEQKRLAHGAELLQTAQAVLSRVDEDEDALITITESSAQRLRPLTEKDARLQPAVDALDQASIQLREAADTLSRYLDKSDLDPARLAEVEGRVDAIFAAARRLRLRPEDLVTVLEQTQKELSLADAAADIGALEAQCSDAEKAYQKMAKALSKAREKACLVLSEKVNHWLTELAMGSMVFAAVPVARDEPSAFGLEDILFTLRNHAQGEAYPLSKVASGGELARISLAISVVTAHAHQIPTLIFDEVDSGIGGNVAHTIGQLLRRLGEDRQVLCVTHLPQVAARGHHHLRVSKALDQDGRPVSQLSPLNDQERVDEIARMLGDEGTKKTSREHAKSLLALV